MEVLRSQSIHTILKTRENSYAKIYGLFRKIFIDTYG